MLSFITGVAPRARSLAARLARSSFDAEGDERLIFLVDQPLEIYGATGLEPSSFRPDKLIPRGLRFAVLDDADSVVAFVTVSLDRSYPKAVSLDFVEEDAAVLKALALADTSAAREGTRHIRVIQIPVVDAQFFWVTGDNPEFIDQVVPQTFNERQFVAELAQRLADKLDPGTTPGPSLDS